MLRRRGSQPLKGLFIILVCIMWHNAHGSVDISKELERVQVSCKSDSDCLEGKRCEDTKWHGMVCKTLPSPCESSADCDPCSQCVEGVLWGVRKAK